MWTREVKEALLEWNDFTLIDAMGSSEGSMGTQVTTRGNVGETAKFAMGPATKVFTEEGREVVPGSGEAGMVAAGGAVPIGYYKDEKKSRTTFREIGGVRYSFPGDWARVEADGDGGLRFVPPDGDAPFVLRGRGERWILVEFR